MDNNTINIQFSKVIESLGYSKEEVKKYTKTFDLPKKIKAIASTYSLMQRKEQILGCLEELKSRNSLLYLLFLKNTLETMAQLNESSKQEIWSVFFTFQGMQVLSYGFNSNSVDFLNNLLEFTIFVIGEATNSKTDLKICDILHKIAQKMDLFDKSLLFSLINLNFNKRYLLVSTGEPIKTSENYRGDNSKVIEKHREDNSKTIENCKGEPIRISENYRKDDSKTIENCMAFKKCYCNTFLKKVTDLIFLQDKIGQEINFLASGENCFEFEKLFTLEELEALKEKFVDQEVYLLLLQTLKSEEGIKTGCDNSSRGIEQGSRGIKESTRDVVDVKATQRCAVIQSSPDNEDFASPVTFVDHKSDDIIKLKNTVMELTIELQNVRMENLSLKSNATRILERESGNTQEVEKPAVKGFSIFNKNKANSEPDQPATVIKKGFGIFNKNKVVPEPEQVEQPAPTAGKGFSIFNKNKANAEPQPTQLAPTGSKGFGIFNKNKANPAQPDQVSTPLLNKLPTDSSTSAAPPKPKFGFGAKKTFKPTLISEKTYSGIKWKKASKSQNQIFSKINYESAEKLFNLAEFDKFESKINKKESSTVTQKVSTVTSVIDHKKSYALNIALGRVKLNNSDLIKSILTGRFENENLVKQLIIYFITHEEHEEILKCNSVNNLQLGRAELMFKEISDLNSFLNALLSLRFKFYFNNRNYSEITNLMKISLNRILKSSELLSLFGTLLVIGNVLNCNTFNGNAEGFTLDSLNVFSSKEILELIRSKINLEKLLKELFGSAKPARIEIISCEISIETLIAELGEAKSLFGEFVDEETVEKFKKVIFDYEEITKIYKELQGYFGENDDGFISKIESFLKLLIQ